VLLRDEHHLVDFAHLVRTAQPCVAIINLLFLRVVFGLGLQDLYSLSYAHALEELPLRDRSFHEHLGVGLGHFGYLLKVDVGGEIYVANIFHDFCFIFDKSVVFERPEGI